MVSHTWNPAGSPKIRSHNEEPAPKQDDRVSLAPLDPVTALRALLATPPESRAGETPQA